MNNNIKLCQVISRLEEENLEYEIINIGDNFRVVCTKKGGRILGPFESDDADSVLWVNEAFRSKETFRKFLNDEEWNLGGDRVWVLPEMPFFVRQRTDFFDTYAVSPNLDPGNYQLSKTQNTVSLTQNVKLSTYETKCKEKEFEIKRKIYSVSDPLCSLSNYESLKGNVKYCGFEQQIELTDLGTDDTLYLETWVLSQINPKGKLSVGYYSQLDYVDYYEPTPKNMITVENQKMVIDVTGDVRYKIGLKAAQISGRASYMGKMPDGTDYLFVRVYNNKPSNIYCGDPYGEPNKYGCSLYLYNDPGSQGGFAEFENGGTTISGDTGVKSSVDTVDYYFYFGDLEKLEKIRDSLT